MDSRRVVSPLFPSSGNLQSSRLELNDHRIDCSQTSVMSPVPPPPSFIRSRPPSPEPFNFRFINTEDPDDYDILQRIGSGGYGHVHKAQNVITGRVCAVKIVKLQPKKLSKQFKEPDLQFRMSHKNVALLLGVYCTEMHLNMVLQYYSGGTLTERIKSAPQQRVKQAEAASYISQIASGLDHIHRLGVIHRDIKEGNIFLSSNGIVKIGDFGIAVERDPSGLNTGYGGTRGWMSPEMVKSLPYTISTDIWSLGVVCYRLLTGKRPFLAHDGSTYSEKIVAGAYPSSMYLEGIAGDLIRRFLNVDPTQRIDLHEVDEIPWIQYHICIAGRRKRPRRVLRRRYIN
ncbi:hypothetical protein FT663_02915 [Candidozyma haemuli var. vulneris]|nr:hypothetical protein FT663_02915 [[Candida] haemuloni var. vulneris]KAF3991331.1 hypothetical protein FT662_01786 [[Candida] haemuloni var. vulneris]